MFGFDSVFYFLLMIGVMILIHELGHFWAARYFGVKVDAFSFGFGPRLFGWKSGDTDFRVSAIPFGGYVKMSGEQPGDEAASDPLAFLAKPRWQRLIIAFAGPFMNVILAVVVLTGLYMVKFPKPPDHSISNVIGLVQTDSAAAKAGIREGDRIVALAGQENPSWQDIMVSVAKNPNQPMPLAVIRDGKRVDVTLTPSLDPEHGFGVAGMFEHAEIQVSEVEPSMDAARKGLRAGDLILAIGTQTIRSGDKLVELIRASQGKPVSITYSRTGEGPKTVQIVPEWKDADGTANWRIGVKLQRRVTYIQLGFQDALVESVRENMNYASLIYNFLSGLFERRMSPKSLEGPIGIARASAEAARSGWADYLQLMSAVSLNLAIFNLLPIPILDGGVILLLLMEMFIRKDLSLQVKETVMKFGFVFLMAVVAFVLYNDISKIFSKG
jgi:regulator of sigma E protease